MKFAGISTVFLSILRFSRAFWGIVGEILDSWYMGILLPVSVVLWLHEPSSLSVSVFISKIVLGNV